jgi:hypothetical protein
MRFKVRLIDIIYWMALIVTDLFIYIVLSLLLMGYDDNYDTSKGEYMSWKSMAIFDKTVFISLNLWHLANVLVIVYIGYRVYKNIKLRTP